MAKVINKPIQQSDLFLFSPYKMASLEDHKWHRQLTLLPAEIYDECIQK